MSEKIGNEKTNNIMLNMIVPADWKHVYIIVVLLAPSLPVSFIVLSMYTIIKYLPRYGFAVTQFKRNSVRYMDY
ncbi:MAG TPA: hypothetical protein VKA09_03095 [Nitrososphaeraceae archaeon]|nr:hypothetical protein [Nitrososphaeraceae archaeon]